MDIYGRRHREKYPPQLLRRSPQESLLPPRQQHPRKLPSFISEGTNNSANSSLPSKVRVAYATLNPVDYKIAESLGPYILSKPAIPGFDYSGTVVASTVPSRPPGTKVFGQTPVPTGGCLASFIIVKGPDACVPIPSGVRLKDAACAGVAGNTAYDTLYPFVKDLPKGAKVLINGGSGGTGTFGIQIAKVLGCYVTTTCSGPNVTLCKDLGADQVLDYRTQPLVPSLTRSGTQYDLIIDNVFASADLYYGSPAYLKPSGRYLTIAASPSFSFAWTALKIFLWPSWLGGGQRKFALVSNEPSTEKYARLGQWIAEGKVKAVVEKMYKLEECGEAFARLKTGRVRGKLVVELEGDD